MTGATVPTGEELQEIDKGLMAQGNLETYANLFEIVFEDKQPRVRLFHEYLEIMRTLALKAPVCSLVKPHIFAAIETVVHGEPVMGVLDIIFKHSPMLGRLLRGANGGPADPLICDLFEDLLEISRKAFPTVDPQVRADPARYHETMPTRADGHCVQTCIPSGPVQTAGPYTPVLTGYHADSHH